MEMLEGELLGLLIRGDKESRFPPHPMKKASTFVWAFEAEAELLLPMSALNGSLGIGILGRVWYVHCWKWRGQPARDFAF